MIFNQTLFCGMRTPGGGPGKMEGMMNLLFSLFMIKGRFKSFFILFNTSAFNTFV